MRNLVFYLTLSLFVFVFLLNYGRGSEVINGAASDNRLRSGCRVGNSVLTGDFPHRSFSSSSHWKINHFSFN